MKIEVFRELTNILNGRLDQKQKTVSQIEENDSSLLAKLFNAIKYNIVTNDEEAKAFLYEMNRENSASNNFRNLKSRLLDTLFNSILIQKKGRSSKHYADALNECYSKLYLLQVLNKDNARRSMQELAKETLRLAERFDLIEIAYLVSKMLKEDAAKNYFESRYYYYKRKTDFYQKVLSAEIEADYFLESLQLRIKNNAVISWALVEEVENTTKYLNNNAPQYFSYKYLFTKFFIQVLSYQLNNNYKKIIKLTNKKINLINKNSEFYQLNYHVNCLIHQMIANFAIGNYKKVNEVNQQISELLSKDNEEWFEWKEKQVWMAFRNQEFTKAKAIIKDFYNNKKCFNIAPISLEKWYFYDFITKFIEKLQRPDFSDDLKFYKFLNEVPQLNKDKNGFSAAIFIYEMLSLLVKKEWVKYSERSEALELFIKRYLNNTNNYRDKLFSRILVKIERQAFDYERTVAKALPLIKELRKNPGSNNLMKINAEFIPYEYLSISVLRFLKNLCAFN